MRSPWMDGKQAQGALLEQIYFYPVGIAEPPNQRITLPTSTRPRYNTQPSNNSQSTSDKTCTSLYQGRYYN